MHIKHFGIKGLRKLGLNHDIDEASRFPLHQITNIQASQINVVIGPNGGGKSTLLDLVRSLADAHTLRTIARENLTTATASGFVVVLEDESRVLGLFNSLADDVGFSLGIGIGKLTPTGELQGTFEGSVSKDLDTSPPQALTDFIQSLNVKVAYRNSHDEVEVSIADYVKCLNASGKHLTGLAPFPLKSGQDAYLHPPGTAVSSFFLENPIALTDEARKVASVSFNDDQRQNNDVPLSMLPSGWKAFGGLIAWLSAQDTDSICVIEEPETHLHPSLLRHLLFRLSEIAIERNLQLFIATHSPILIDINHWPTGKVNLLEANGHELRELTEPSLALGALGVRPSDVCLANGVIWVEGASDRIYLLHWLNLWCKDNQKACPIENLDFCVLFYGGSMLKHFSTDSASNLIDIFKINRNAVVIMDRDLDTGLDVDSTESRTATNAKHDISRRLKFSGQLCWITEGYTIESYLPKEFRERYYKAEGDRLKSCTSVRKVTVAERFTREVNALSDSYDHVTNLPAMIESLYKSITAWSL